MPKRPTLASTTPGMSSRFAGPWLSWSPNQASGMSARPMGTLTQKIQFQASPSTMAPPTSGPIAIARPADGAPGTEREAAPVRRDRGGEQRQRERRDDGAADALRGAGDDERLDGRRHRGGRGRGGEDRDADDEHAAPSEPIAERGAGQQQDRERERVGVDGPFQLLERRAEILADDVERGRDDEVVEHDHDQGDGRHPERPQCDRPVLHRSCLLL